VELLMLNFKQFLGPEATKKHDKEEIARQKKHLMDKAKASYDQAEREGEANGGAARAKGDIYVAAKNNIKEDGMMGVAGIAGSGDARLAPSQREPGVSKKRTPLMLRLARRKLPKM
jgi:hypothetical protein